MASSSKRTRSFGRKVSTAIGDRARRYSMAVAPQLVRVEGLDWLEQVDSMEIEPESEEQVTAAIELYIFNNGCSFAPITFVMRNDQGSQVLLARLTNEELTVFEGGLSNVEPRRLFLVSSLGGGDKSHTLTFSRTIAKIKHPTTGMKLFTLVSESHNAQPLIVHVHKTMQESNETMPFMVVKEKNDYLLRMSVCCGCGFSARNFDLFGNNGKLVGQVAPKTSWSGPGPNGYKVGFEKNADVDQRMLALTFALYQMLHEAYPPLSRIMEEQWERVQKNSSW